MARADVLGINVHPGRPGIYSDVPRMVADLRELYGPAQPRVRYRDLAQSVTTQLRDAGLHCTVICATLAEADRAYNAGAHRLEGRNEWNLAGDPNWVAGYRTLSQQIYTRYGGKVPVLAGALGFHSGFEALSLVPETDMGNVHYYPGGSPQWEKAPAVLADVFTRNRINSGSKAVVYSETGFHNAMAQAAGQRPTSEADAAARLGPWLDICYGGAAEVYLYEHLDEGTDPANQEHNWGLVRNDWSRKPIWAALQVWLAWDPVAQAGAEVDAALAVANAAMVSRDAALADLAAANGKITAAIADLT